MRTNKDFVKRNIGGENILVAVGDASKIFNGMISLNPVASFIWDNVDECGDVDKLVKRVLETFEIVPDYDLDIMGKKSITSGNYF